MSIQPIESMDEEPIYKSNSDWKEFHYYKDLFDWHYRQMGWLKQKWTAWNEITGQEFTGKVHMMHETGIVLKAGSTYKSIHFNEWALKRLP